jgi:hypothetical protein
MYSYSDNDDDIFDDSSYLTDSSNENTFDSTNSITNEEKEFSSLIDGIFGKEDILSHDSDHLIPKMVILFYKSVTQWIEAEYDQFFQRAVISFNDHLLASKAKPFPFYEKYYSTINSVARRRIVNIFLKDMLDDTDTIATLAKNVDFPLTKESIQTYFGSFYNINQFAILKEFAEYKALAQYLDLPFSDKVMVDTDEHGSVYGPEPYGLFLEKAFASVADEQYADEFKKAMKESIETFVKIKIEEED